MSIDKQSVKIAGQAIVCSEQTRIEGDVTVGSKTVIHPTAVILAQSAPIVIGESNLIEENVTIVNTHDTPMTIGSHNVFEVGAHSSAPTVGDHNVFESKCSVGPETRVSNGCVIGAMCALNCDQLLPENTVVFGSDCKRRVQHEKPASQTYQLDFLSKILPNYQRIEKSNYVSANSLPNSSVSTQ